MTNPLNPEHQQVAEARIKGKLRTAITAYCKGETK